MSPSASMKIAGKQGAVFCDLIWADQWQFLEKTKSDYLAWLSNDDDMAHHTDNVGIAFTHCCANRREHRAAYSEERKHLCRKRATPIYACLQGSFQYLPITWQVLWFEQSELRIFLLDNQNHVCNTTGEKGQFGDGTPNVAVLNCFPEYDATVFKNDPSEGQTKEDWVVEYAVPGTNASVVQINFLRQEKLGPTHMGFDVWGC